MRHSEKRSIVDELSGYTVFATCTREDIEALVDACGHFALPAQWSLVQEGIPADAAYVILEGKARVFRERDVVAELGPGDLVGEMALLSDGQRSATVSSVTRLRGLRFDYEKLVHVMKHRPRLIEAVRSVVASRALADATS